MMMSRMSTRPAVTLRRSRSKLVYMRGATAYSLPMGAIMRALVELLRDLLIGILGNFLYELLRGREEKAGCRPTQEDTGDLHQQSDGNPSDASSEERGKGEDRNLTQRSQTQDRS
jgi:hypothetical protein